MAIIYSDIAAKSKAMMPSQGIADASFSLTGLLVTQSIVQVPANAAAGDRLVLTQKLPKGIALVPSLCRVVKSGGNAAMLTVKVGDSKNAARYASPMDLKTSQAVPTAVGFAGGSDMTAPAQCKAGEEIVATIETASGVTACTLVYTLVFASIA